MELPEQIWFLMSRNLSGEAGPEEQQELMERLQEQPGLVQQYEMLKRVWAAYSPQQEAAPAETARINHILQLSAQLTYHIGLYDVTGIVAGNVCVEKKPHSTLWQENTM